VKFKIKTFIYLVLVLIVVGFVGVALMKFPRFPGLGNFEGSPDGWLSYWGGIFGSGIGVIGALFVLREQINFEKVDNTFFNLLNMHNEILNSIRLQNNPGDNIFDITYFMMKSGVDRKNNEIMEGEKIQYLSDNKVEFIRLITSMQEDISELASKNSDIYNKYSGGSIVEAKEIISSYISNFNHAISRGKYSAAIDSLDQIISSFFDRNTYSSVLDTSKQNFSQFYELYSGMNSIEPSELSLEQKKEIIESSLDVYYGEIGNYFRTFHRIIKFINENVKELDVKANYIGFLRAMINEKEMIVIFYNAFYSRRGTGLAEQLEYTDFFGKLEDLPFDNKLEAQHFNKKLLLWGKSDIEKMNTLKLQRVPGKFKRYIIKIIDHKKI
jgi:hypothetical protein